MQFSAPDRVAALLTLALGALPLPASVVVGQHDNPGGIADEITAAEAMARPASVPNYAFLPVRVEGFPMRVTPDGTAILGVYNAGDVYAYRWHRGVVTELSCIRPPGTRIRLHAANRNGMVVVVFELPTRALFAFEGGLTKQVVVAWMPDSTTPVFLNVPIAKATTWFDQSTMRSVEFKQLDDQNRIWGDTYHEVDIGEGNLTYPELARWDSTDAEATFIGHKQHQTPSVILLGVSSVNGEPFGHYFPSEPGVGGYPFAGTFANRLTYVPSRMNRHGWVLGRSGSTPKLSRQGVEYPIPPVSSIIQIDDRNNLLDGGFTVWTTNLETFNSVPTPEKNSYVAAATTPIALAEGFGTNQRVIPGNTDIMLNTLFGPTEATPALFVPADLRPDANRDGMITTGLAAGDPDRALADLRLPWYYWVNDDDDAGETDGSDIPGGGSNGRDSSVNGVRDLIDFFPLRLNITRLLDVVPPDTPGVSYRLVQADGAANFIMTDLNPALTGDYHRDPAVARTLANVAVTPITPEGAPLDPAFLGGLTVDTKGVILVEARRPTRMPLRLEAWRGTEMIARVDLPLSFAGVEAMFRHRNLVKACNMQPLPEAADRVAAPNWPEILDNDQAFLFLHGYNVNQREARGWHAEFFKRLWWTGSKAQFWGVTWYGSDSQLGTDNNAFTPNYHLNVTHAFGTSKALKQVVADIGSKPGIRAVNVAAHSLGNMVVSSAISDHGAPISRYFLLNAAVPTEAFDATETENPSAVANMPHTDWTQAYHQEYPRQLWASHWHERFPATGEDKRRLLTWRNRFSTRGNTTYFNLFSTGDHVLALDTGTTPTLVGVLATELKRYFQEILPAQNGQPNGYRTWAYQEKLKGRTITGKVLGSNFGGWGFNNFYFKKSPGGAGGKGPVMVPEAITPSEATALLPVFTDETLREVPFFRPGGFWTKVRTWIHDPVGRPALIEDQLRFLYHPAYGSGVAERHRDTLLARMIPALSFVTGQTTVKDFNPDSVRSRNFDINAAAFRGPTETPVWPSSRGGDTRWRHSDLRAIALPYVRSLYDKLIELGELRKVAP